MSLNLYYDGDFVVRMFSKEKIVTNKYKMVKANIEPSKDLIGKKIKFDKTKGIRLALICNWNDQCGISTYTQYLIDKLAPKVDSLRIFAEERNGPKENEKYDVDYCWKRGQSMRPAVNKVLEWNPSVILIQHEFGIFPKANYFLPMMEAFAEIPTVTTVHSVYEHRDKSVCTSAMKNVIVHSESGKNCLINTLGHKNQNVNVIPHGCVDFGEVEANWNYFGVDHPILQFGFGFNYKGVDVALEAIAKLKASNPKYKDIFYCYMLSESNHAKNTHSAYASIIKDKIKDLGLEDNATIQRGFFSDEELNQHLRTARMAIFPYVTDPNNVVYGASGAVRIAMANNTPTIVSASHMFDDLAGTLDRPFGADQLADTIAKTFENSSDLLKRQRKYIIENTWEITAQRYYRVLKELVDKQNSGVIII